MQVYIKENSRLARLAARKMKAEMLAMAWGNTILLHNATRQEFLSDEAWVRHELCHIEQFRVHGFMGFLWKYTIESLRKGYYHNRFEIEARAAEHQPSLIHSISPD